MKYRDPELLVRDTATGRLADVEAKDFQAMQSLPRFMVAWGEQAEPTYGSHRIVTSTVNASNGCQIGDSALCGQFCFAHLGWKGTATRTDIPAQYAREAKQLRERGYESSIFLSTDTEPLPGKTAQVTDVTRRLLLEMLKEPPKGLIIHTHTDVSASDEVLPIIKDLSDATNVIVGIGFETDVEEPPNGLPRPFTSIKDRLHAVEKLSNHGVKTQAAVAPLLGFENFEQFGKVFSQIGTYRVMVGELRLDFEIGGTAKATTLRERLGLPFPSQDEAKAFFESQGFPPERVAFRDQFYVVLPEEGGR